jgi:hypothetical protein
MAALTMSAGSGFRSRRRDCRRCTFDTVPPAPSQDDFGQLADPGVDAVHDLPLLDLVLQQSAALVDPCLGFGRKLNLLVLPGDLNDLFDGQAMPVNDDGHVPSSSI